MISQTSLPSASLSTRASSAEYVANQIKSHKTGLAIIVLIAVAAFVALGIIGFKLFRDTHPQAISLEAATFTRLTTNGNATGAAISPDGKWLVHVQDDGEQQSLWLRQVAVENSNTQIVP